MGWLIACEQARFFLRLSFLAFPPSAISQTPHVPRDAVIHSLSAHPPLYTTFTLMSRHAHVAILSSNYTFIPPCIFAASLQAFNMPDYVMMHKYVVNASLGC